MTKRPIDDETVSMLAQAPDRQRLRKPANAVPASLADREQRGPRNRFGIVPASTPLLEDLECDFSATRERGLATGAKALRKHHRRGTPEDEES